MSQQPLLFLRPLILTLIPPYMLAGDLLRGAHLKFHLTIRAVVCIIFLAMSAPPAATKLKPPSSSNRFMRRLRFCVTTSAARVLVAAQATAAVRAKPIALSAPAEVAAADVASRISIESMKGMPAKQFL